MVCGFHSCLADGVSPVGQYLGQALHIVFDGRTGVSIFFVLSGLVLGMSLRRDGPVTSVSYLRFLFRRFFRIWPAYFVTTICYLILYFTLKSRVSQGLPIGHGWNDFLTHLSLSGAAIIKNFIFLDQSLNIATWTLKVEMEAAFLLPLMHAYSLRFRTRGWIILLVALLALSLWPGSRATRANLYLFYLGYLIPPMLEALRSTRFTERFLSTGWLLTLALAALALSHLISGNFGLIPAGIGATLLLILLQIESSHPLFAVLDFRLVKFLGMVSYSFYLVNLLSADFVQRMFSLFAGIRPGQTLATWFFEFILTSLLGLALASVFFYLVERPSVKLGGSLWPSRPPTAASRPTPAKA